MKVAPFLWLTFARLVEGTISTLPGTALTPTQGFKLVGASTFEYFGSALSSAGDFNNDGHADMIIGASGSDSAGTNFGSAYIIFSNKTARDLDVTNFAAGNQWGIRLNGDRTSGSFGYSVGGGGDVNGDGFDDVVVGAVGDGAGIYGMVYVIFGYRPATISTTIGMGSVSWGTKGFRVQSTDLFFGSAVAIAGDVNDDGYDDVLIGSYVRGSYCGGSYVIFGHSNATTFSDVNINSFTTGSVGFRIACEAAGDSLGYRASGAGDFNNDGIDDYLIGAYNKNYIATGAGVVYVLFGIACTTGCADINLATYTTSTTHGFRIWGQVNGNMGTSVAAAGDVNGDNIDDIIVGMPYNANGHAYVLFGKTGAGAADIYTSTFTTTDSLGFRITGTTSSQLGRSVAGAGDVNGDGYDDVVVGAPGGWTSGEGVSIVYFGKASGYNADVAYASLNFGTDSFAVYGGVTGDYMGWTVAGIGDFNQDGIDDIACNWYGYNSQTGAVAIVYGFALPTLAPTNKPSASPTRTPTALPTPVPTAPPTAKPTTIPTALPTASPTLVPTTAPTVIPTASPTLVPTAAPTVIPTASPTLVPTAAPTVVPTASPTLVPTAAPTVIPTASPTLMPTAAPTVVPTASPTLVPTAAPTVMPTTSPTLVPTAVPTVMPTTLPKQDPTAGPTMTPTANPTAVPTMVPTGMPTATPTIEPTTNPTEVPTTAPTTDPSTGPTATPTLVPTSDPTVYPTQLPTREPTMVPTANPSAAPTPTPTAAPTVAPSIDPTMTPTQSPTVDPTVAPTAAPSVIPSVPPTASPTIVPSAAPTIDPAIEQLMLSSPTYTLRNGYAFAVRAANSTVYTWGEGKHGGDSSAVSALLANSVIMVVPSLFAFSATRSSGVRVTAWGIPQSTTGIPFAASSSSPLVGLVANEGAFAAIDSATGALVTFGSKHHGGNITLDTLQGGAQLPLPFGFSSITASAAAFAALRSDGSVYCWGSNFAGGGPPFQRVTSSFAVVQVVATRDAFAARTAGGGVLTWGSPSSGGDSSQVQAQLQHVVHLVASRSVFAAFTRTLGLVVWGARRHGGEASAVQALLNSEVVFVAHTFVAMVAVKVDGSVVAWGSVEGGGDSSAVQALLIGIVKVVGNSKAFAALNATGGVVAWGKATYGGEIPADKTAALASGVVSISHTDRAFAALKSDGSVVVWGQAGHGGSPGAAVEALLSSGVHTICANDVAFSAIKTDGRVVSWGHEVSVPLPGVQFTSPALVSGAVCA